MLVSELAKTVHENAVQHGWWDEEREAPEILALIHSEWSEALEEARAGRPMVYRLCPHCDDGPCYIVADDSCSDFTWEKDKRVSYRMANDCEAKEIDWTHEKPDGIAVELIDGCIRILDYAGKLKTEFNEKDGSPSSMESLYSDANALKVPEKLPELVAYLHMYTSACMSSRGYVDFRIPDMLALITGMAVALSWVKKQGLDPLAILLEKHEFNKSRPYKHGKKF